MALSPSNRYRNFVAAAMASVSITGVKKITQDNQAQVLQEAADADQYPTHTVLTFQNPSFSIHGIDAMGLSAVLSGVSGVFTYKMNDSKNLGVSGGGAVIFTTNAFSIIGNRSLDGDFNQLVTETLTVFTTSIDGTTNPVGVASA